MSNTPPDLDARADLPDTSSPAMIEDMTAAVDQGTTARVLSRDVLLPGGLTPSRPVPMSELGPSLANDLTPPAPLTLQLTLRPTTDASWTIKRDDAGYTSDLNRKLLPPIDFAAHALDDGSLVPATRRLQLPSAPDARWAFILGAGKTWREPEDTGWSRAALPFTLVEPGANCSFHGVLTFLYDADGATSDAYYQVSQETCLYLSLDLWGRMRIDASDVEEPARVIDAADRWRARRERRPEVSPLDVPVAEEVREHVTVRGVFADGRHYRSSCNTRHGDHPFCDELAFPSFSTAKSAVAGVAYAHLATLQPEAELANTPLGDALPALPEPWQTTTLAQLLDMRTIHYESDEYMSDEGSGPMISFLYTSDWDEKLALGTAFARQDERTWVYQTSQTYLATLLMQHIVGEDLYDWLVTHVYEPLDLSETARDGLRTTGARSQHYGGYGSWWLSSDLVTLARLIGGGHERADLIDPSARALMLSPDGDAPTQLPGLGYSRSIWHVAFGQEHGFDCAGSVPLMFGYGGISVAILPGDVIYYEIMDDGGFDWLARSRELAPLVELCPSP